MVIGADRALAGPVEVRFRLLDAVKQTQLTNQVYTIAPAQFRATAHKIADVIYEALTGDQGVFQHADRLHRQAGAALRIAGRRRRRA